MKTERERKFELVPVASDIEAFIKLHGSGPTIREIAGFANVKSSSHAHKIVSRLIKYGFITKEKKKHRSIKMARKLV